MRLSFSSFVCLRINIIMQVDASVSVGLVWGCMVMLWGPPGGPRAYALWDCSPEFSRPARGLACGSYLEVLRNHSW